MVVSVIRADISEEEREKIICKVKSIAREMLRDMGC